MFRTRKRIQTTKAIAAGSLAFLAATALAQAPPTAVIDNGKIHATVYLPDAANGFYKGTRFDWAGIIGKLTAGGHTYYDQWFTRVDPAGSDFVYGEQEIVAGPASAATGIPEEFSSDGGALGYADAKVGATFVKIGVGALRKPQEEKYNHYNHYEIADGGKRTVAATKTSITFTQDLLDATSGYGYVYTKTIRLVPGTSQLVLEHTLKNTGTKSIDTRVYDHNFLTLDHLSPGPDFTVTVPFAIAPKRAINEDLGYVNANIIGYKKVLEGKENFVVALGGYSGTVADYDFRVENKKANAMVHIQGDQPLESVMLWSMRATLAVEPYIKLSVAPGQETHWKYTYTYSPVTK